MKMQGSLTSHDNETHLVKVFMVIVKYSLVTIKMKSAYSLLILFFFFFFVKDVYSCAII